MDKVGFVLAILCGLLFGFNCTDVNDCSLANTFGRNCSLSCNCLEGCHDNGKCHKCVDGWFGPTCQIKLVNAALNKNASHGPSFREDHPASLAVDGDISDDAKWAYAYDETKAENSIVWWSVDLGSFVKIINLKIVYLDLGVDKKHHERTLKRRQGHSVWISNASDPLALEGQRCFHDDGQGQQNATLNINCSGIAKYVRIYTSRNKSLDTSLFSKRPNLEIVEMEAYIDAGCSVGTYGDLCQEECGHCEARECTRDGGFCDTCLPGWAGDTCAAEQCDNCANNHNTSSGCIAGWYSANCSLPCEGNCFNNQCNIDTGHCSACPAGWKGSLCNETCSTNCNNTGCKIDGTCYACVDKQYHGSLCTEACSTGCDGCYQNNGTCIRCQYGKYGVNCENNCSSKCNKNECDRQGHCSVGCKDAHFYGAHCDIECASTITNCLMCIAPGGTPACYNCSSAKFGNNCENDCPEHCELCTDSKYCTKCATGYNGTTCNCNIRNCLECGMNGYCVSCVPGLFGQQCDKSCQGCETCKSGATDAEPICLTCRDSLYLNQSNGQCTPCPWTCKHCSSATECSECQSGYYGNDCGNKCPRNCLPDITNTYICDGKLGTCSGDCKDGFYGDFCNISCYDNCGTNSGRHGCNKRSGECFSCKDGYHGQFCNETCSINCVPASSKDLCNRDTGKCVECKDMWFGDKCEQECPENCDLDCNKETGKCDVCKSGFYGQYCREKCPRYCGPEPGSTKVVCNILNAECLHCKTGFYGERCNKYCESRCALRGNFADCEKSDGHCKGCQSGFYGEFCDAECTHCNDKACQQNSGYCDSGCETGWYNKSCNERCSSTCKEENCDKLTGVCLMGCVDGYTGQFCKSRKTEPEGPKAFVIIIGVAVPIILIMLGVLIFLMLRYRKSREKPGYRASHRNLDINGRAENGEQLALIESNGSTVVNNLPLPKKVPKNTSLSDDELLERDVSAPSAPASTDPSDYYNLSWPIPVAEFPAYVRDKRDQYLFWYRDDFNKLPKGLLKKYNVSMEIANKGKCRYKQLYPYDDNRVKLEPDGDITSDFINASYVNGYKKPQAYIAAQGPTDVNVADFWRMIWQKDCGKIVMLTNLFEECKMKCVRYWPEPDEHQDYGNLEVVLSSENVFPDYTLRHLQVTHKITREEKDFMLFHFTAWPDRGVPDNPGCMLNFRTKVMEEYGVPDGPILVHCSAGIGRTGTFVALDFLLNRAAMETHVDVFRTITDMRYQRTNFVQTDVQYDFLHNAIAEALTTKEMEVEASEFCQLYWSLLEVNPDTGKTRLQEQFEVLKEMSPVLDSSSYQAGNKEENICKNRDPDILPVDMYRAYLSTPTKGSNEYVNAVFLPTALNRTGFLLTQMPLPHTVTDFWRLVYDQHVTTIVMMNNIDDNDDSIGEYWPSDDCTYGPFKVELLSCENFDVYSLLTIKLTYSSTNRQSSLVVKQYRFEGWPDGDPVPQNAFSLTTLIGTVAMASNNHSEKPTIVHCMNGAERSGLFCVLSAIFERLQSEKKVNIPQTILNWRSRRPQIIPTLEQFDYCYKVVAEYLDSQQIYSNVL